MFSNDKIKLIIADDNATFIEALNFFLSKYEKFKVIDICNNGLELVESKKLFEADVLLVDVQMPELDGISAGKKINQRFPKLPMIAITMIEGAVYLDELVYNGFRGYVHKLEIPTKLIDTIDKVLNKTFVFPNHLKI